MNIILVLALAMAFGLLFTRIMKFIGLPNVTGYLIAGLLIGPYVLKIFTAESLATVDIITNVALGFIAFSIGSSFKLSHLKELGKSVITITFFQALTAVALVDIVLWLFGAPLPLALTLGAIATATAPAATLMVVRQYKAKGILTNTLLPVVAFDDAIGLMVFSISLAIAKVLATGSELTVTAILWEPLYEIAMSLVIGAALGVVLSFVSRFFKSRANRMTLILCAAFFGLALAKLLNLSNLLVCMMIGAFYTNMFKEYERPLDVLDRWTYPLYMLFFVISGAELNITVIPQVGIIGILYLIARFLGKYFGAYAGAKIVHADKHVTKYLGLTLLPQAGVAIGMAQIVITALPDYGSQISTIVLCATLVYELIGPLLTKLALSKAGEIDPSVSSENVFTKLRARKQRLAAIKNSAGSSQATEQTTAQFEDKSQDDEQENK